jgi:hypothetical protein
MSRWHDKSLGGTTTWASLTLDERLADRVSDILLTAHEVHELMMIAADRPELRNLADVALRIYEDASALSVHLPTPRDIPQRDPELALVLDRITRALNEISILHGSSCEYDLMLGWVEQMAAPDVLSLFHEIERLDTLLGHSPNEKAWGASGFRVD